MRETLPIFDFFFHNYYCNLGTALRVIESVSIRRHRHMLASDSPCFRNLLECIQAEFVALCSSSPPRHRSSFSNHIRATLAPNPNLVHSPSLHVDSRPDAICYLFAIRLIRIPQGHFAIDNKMRCQPAVRVGSIV